MKFTIEGFSQFKLLEWDLDCTDAVILRYIIDFYQTNKMIIEKFENEDFFWIKYEELKKQLPILKLKESNDGLRLRFKKYEKCGLMKHQCKKNKFGSYSFYKFTEKYEELITTQKDFGTTTEKIQHPCRKNSAPNNKSINNKSINNKSFNKLKDNRFEKPVNSDNSPNKEIKKTKQPKINDFTIKIITLWNNCQAVPVKHKTNRYYKFHSKVQKYITHLKAGTFGDIIDLSRDYMRRCSIMEKDLTKKYTEAEIEKIVSNCLLAYKEGYWPTNKKILPKSISELFYTTPFYSTKYVPGESKSHFLYIHARPPRQLRKAKSSEAIDREMEAFKPVRTKEEEEIVNRNIEILLENTCLPPHMRKEVRW